MQGVRCKVLGAGCGVQGARCRVQGVGCQVQGVGCKVQGVGCEVQGVRCRAPGVGCKVPGAGLRRPACKDLDIMTLLKVLCHEFVLAQTLTGPARRCTRWRRVRFRLHIRRPVKAGKET